MAFTSDARNKWAKNWIGWGNYQQFWRQLTQWTLRKVENASFAVNVATDRGDGQTSLDAVDSKGEFQNFLNLQAVVVDPNHGKQTISLQQTGPGHYEGRFRVCEIGEYLLNIMQMENGLVRASQAVGASLNYSPELEASGLNLGLLKQIAESTGGKVLDPSRPGSNPFFNDRRKTWQSHDLWQELLKFAIVLFVFDVGIRRIRMDREQVENACSMMMGTIVFWRKASPSAAESEPSLATLLVRRKELRIQQVSRTEPPETKKTELQFGKNIHASESSESSSESLVSSNAVTSTTDRLLEAKRRLQRPK